MKAKLEDVCERGSSNLRQSDVEEMSGDYPIYGASGYIGNVDFYHNEFRAYAYLNNQIKHDKDLEFIYFEVAESVHPMFYPFQFDSPGLCWKNFRDNGRANARGKREHYEAHLMDRDVKATLSKMKETIVSTTHIVEEMKS